jgi:hypothetical protein
MTTEKMLEAAIKEARTKMGAGWAVLSKEMRFAFVAAEVVKIIAANAENQGWERAGALADLALKLK